MTVLHSAQHNIVTQTGVVITIKDGIAQVLNLTGAFLGETIWITSATKNTEHRGMVVGLKEGITEVVMFEGMSDVSEGDVATKSGNTLGLLASDKLLGRAIDSLGRPIDGKPLFQSTDDAASFKFQAFFNNAPEILDRDPVNESLETGYKGVDSLIPIGLGQRELVIGDRKTGKTSLLMDTVINQRDKGVRCVYVMIGQKRAELARMLKELKEANALDNTVIVSADSAQPAGMQYVAAFAGCAVAEKFS